MKAEATPRPAKASATGERPPQRLLRVQHKRRLSLMPWLYFGQTKPHLEWTRHWQAKVQARLMQLEAVEIAADCFVAPEAHIIGEQKRPVILGPGCSIAAHAYVHGPISLGADVSINPYAWLDGGKAGVTIGDGSRIAAHVRIVAFEHGIAASSPIRDQAVRSLGIHIGSDVWIGAGAGITDGVTIGNHAVVGMGSVVTRDVPPWAVVGGAPARVLGDRRTWPSTNLANAVR
jgi:acetyltransferase-like isoleucine patch superfamily enzyme